jgi:hypothetical protein
MSTAIGSNVVYVNGAVYEREGGNQVFFAREYDQSSFLRLAHASGYEAQSIAYISRTAKDIRA